MLSYLWLRGRCRNCAARISLRYPSVELVTGLTFAALAVRFGPSWLCVLYCVFAAGLIAAAMIDYDHQIIPDSISLGGLGLALCIVPLVHRYYGAPYVEALLRSGIGAAILRSRHR